MNAKDAISQAKTLLQDLYADEDVADVRLEEVEFDETSDSWLVTLGIMRPGVQRAGAHLFGPSPIAMPLKRTYKVVTVPESGISRPSIKIRSLNTDD